MKGKYSKYLVCVKECPDTDNIYVLDCKTNSVVTSCKNSEDFIMYKSKKLFKSLCIPRIGELS